MSNALQVFDFEKKQVRIVMVDGEPQFVARDIVEGIGAVWNGEAAIAHVPDEWKGVRLYLTPGGEQETWFLQEQGVYFYLARSNKPAALPFQKKIAGEILPQIRKTGVYMTTEAIEKTLTNPDFIIGLASKLKEEQQKVRDLEAQIARDRPLVLFAQTVQAGNALTSPGDYSKMLRQAGFRMGRNRLFRWLREKDYVIRRGHDRSMPTQKAVEQGLLAIEETSKNDARGKITITKRLMITPKGRIHFSNLFVAERVAAFQATHQKLLWDEDAPQALTQGAENCA